MKRAISVNVIRRLPRYLRKLDELCEQRRSAVSSVELGEMLGLTPSQIRQNFSNFGEFGQQGYGYDVRVLRDEMRSILGMNRNYSVIIVGTGRLGQVLLENFSRLAVGYELLGTFDTDPEVIGKAYCGFAVKDAREMHSFISEHRVDFAVLAVPVDAAQQVTDDLVKAGIRGIWNFTNYEIRVGDSDTLVENLHFADSFLTLSYYLAAKDKNV